MKLLVSPVDVEEAKTAVSGGVDIIDVKNPAEGSLGGQYPWVIREIKKITPAGIEISAAVCDSVEKPGLITQALLGVLSLGVDYAKIGLYKPSSEAAVRDFIKLLCKVKSEFGFSSRIVIAGYADWRRAGSINPMVLPSLAEGLDVTVLMIDTFIKDGKTTFDFLSLEQLKKFSDDCKLKGFQTAIAGRILETHLFTVKTLGYDILGVRSLVCERGDRVNGRIVLEKIKQVKRMLR
ncbi:MAG: (5-formylfuran-3-yl)methyl phosphate synthase [Candidatus Odinarchaeota archaeon]